MAPNTLTKYDLKKFDGSNDFSLWRIKMHAILIQQGLLKALKEQQGLPDTMSNDEKEDMLERAHSSMLLKDCPELNGKKKDNSKTANAGVVEDNSDGADVLSVTIISSDGGWILDTGYSYHMCPNRDWFVTYRSFDSGKVLMGNNVACKVVGIGSIQIRMHDGIVRTLTDVRHVPELRKILISLGTLDSNGCSYRAVGGVMRIMKGALVVMKGHMSERSMDVLSKQGLLGSKKTGRLDFSEHCVFGKQCRVKFSQAVHTTKGTVDYIHSDLWGPSTVPSKGGGRYMLTFIDDFSRKTLEEDWSGKHANYENLRIFDCPAYSHVNDGKLEPRAKKCIFLGYENGVKGYWLWCPDSKSSKFLISRDVTFDESSMLLKKRELIDVGKDHSVREKVELEVQAPDSLPIIPINEDDGSHSTEQNEEPQEQQYNIARNRLRREIRPPKKYGYADMVAYALSVAESIEVEKPVTYKKGHQEHGISGHDDKAYSKDQV
ncbi:hypothetical protein RJ639_033263 [Escallonia herrerae]|uniref:Polyprotein n=1 Tax=Escallonia herrerae TaxID=1293975 RepID=A0AA88X2U1_9ASTE|nr:hypothetical protein RJ639_033263 [Escallonia herrerae]